MDLMRLVESSADAASQLWLDGIMRVYRLPHSSATEHLSDSRILLRHISVAWLRLGRKMLHDAHSQGVPKGERELD